MPFSAVTSVFSIEFGEIKVSFNGHRLKDDAACHFSRVENDGGCELSVAFFIV